MNEAPANEYERFLLGLPPELREECQTRMAGSGLSPNHPIFTLLADFYEKTLRRKEAESIPSSPSDEKDAPDFLQEAQLHSQLSKQLLAEFGEVPEAILAQIEPQLTGLLQALTGPVETLTTTATALQRNVEALPHLFGGRRRTGPWLVSGVVCAALALAVTAVLLGLGTTTLSRRYETAYQRRLGALEAGSAEDTATLNRLLTAGIAIKLERNPGGDGYFLVLRGIRRAAQPVNSPEGLAVQIWP